MKNKSIIYLAILLFVGSCKEKEDSYYFNGKINEIEIPQTQDSIKGSKLILNDIYTGWMSVHDTLILLASEKYPEYYVSVFSTVSGDYLGSYCKKGIGPDEYLAYGTYDQFINENNEIKLWVNDYNKGNLSLFNITKSVKEKNTHVDKIMNYKDNYTIFQRFNFIFPLDNSNLLVRIPPIQRPEKINTKYRPPYYAVFNANDTKATKEITLFNNPVYNTNYKIEPRDYYHSIDRIKNDNNKIAMGMWMTNQINILDVETGDLKGYRIKGTYNFSGLSKSKNVRFYYNTICVDDDYIYALYANSDISDESSHFLKSTDIVHVLDWNGNFIKTIILDEKVQDLKFDPVNKYLYSMNQNEEIFYYDLSYLY